MKTVYLDFETFYSDQFSLRKMTPVEYVLDPRFQVNGCAIIEGEGAPFWLDGPQLPAYFASLDPKVTSLVTHNALFDMCIVAWHYGFIPRLMGCTMSVARTVLGHKLKYASLESVAKHLNVGLKGGTLSKVKGMDLQAIKDAGLYDEYVAYGKDDVAMCAAIYRKLVIDGRFPFSELVIMDMVLRCAIQPQLQLCHSTLAQHLGEVQAKKAQLLDQAVMIGASDKSDLMSNERFAELLRSAGVEPPVKVSPTTGQQTYAFAKTDTEFLDLQEHPSPDVQVLVAARLGHKTTLEETRCQRFLSISQLQWPATFEGNPMMPMPLAYGAAHTHRLGGTWKLNVQNLGRGSKLRRALIAPSHHKVVTVDSAQVEARGVAVLAGQDDLTEAFSQGRDVYSEFASIVFGYPVTKANKAERFVGKMCILGLGYGLGGATFKDRLKTASKDQLGTAIELTDIEAARYVNTYRGTYIKVPLAWRVLNYEGISALQRGHKFSFGPCEFEREAILLPSGLRLYYHHLHQVDGEWWFTYGGIPKKLYGGKLLENICQSLARVAVMEAGIRIRKRLGRSFALQAHDELVFVVPDEAVEETKAVCLEEMSRRPAWLPNWPLAAEVGVGQSYGEAK